MDLGFGNANQVVGQVASSALATMAQAQEAALDHELDQYDALLNDDDALDRLRERRLRELKQTQQQRNVWKDQGHGVYSELVGTDTAKAFFDVTKQSERLVVHFYRPSTRYCDIFHKHLAAIAETHWETRFIKINVESSQEGNKGLQYLIDKLHIHVMPTVVLIHKRKQVHQFRGFDDLGGHEDFSTNLLKHVLAAYDVLTLTSSEMDQFEDQEWLQEDGGVNSIKLQTIRRGIYDAEEEHS